MARYRERYAGEPFVRVVDDAPWVSADRRRSITRASADSHCRTDGRRLVAVATLDNLLKGAATQAMQNLNLRVRTSTSPPGMLVP